MHIDIAQRLRPFSHTPGSCCLLPGTPFMVEVFPSLIRLYDLNAPSPVLRAELPVNIEGPVDEFTITLDLEKAWITVQGRSVAGFFRYRILSCGILAIKSPVGALFPEGAFLLPLIEKEQIFSLAPLPTDRLSLGNHKAQDWDLVKRRLDLAEVFPVWVRLAQLMLPQKPVKPRQGTATLLTVCEDAIAMGRPEQIVPVFKKLFVAAFHHLLVPRFHDDQHQGIVRSVDMDSLVGSPLLLLQEGAEIIRRLFIDIQSDHVSILPALPPEFHCGRWLHISLPRRGLLDMEWSKKTIRRVIFHATDEGQQREAMFRFPSGVKSFRLRCGPQDRGQRLQINTSFSYEAGQQYFLDSFL
jgi:hypothetical protein